ncbi:MAG: zinc-dependent metalloprotease [Fibrobacterota bacterium]|nr:zinc-dependent metalloprotease [Fibrobacterota bacterium]
MTDNKSGERIASVDTGLPLLFSSESPTGEPVRTFPEEKRIRLVALNTGMAADGGALLASAQHFTLNLFDDAQFTAEVDRAEMQEPGRFTLNGRLSGVDESYFVLSFNQGAISVTVFHPSRGMFEIEPTGELVAKISEYDAAKMPKVNHGAIFTNGEPHHLMPEAGPALPIGLAKGAAASVLDIMIVYTAAAVTGAGGEIAMKARIDKAVAEANNAFLNSRIETRLNLVRAQQITYSESGNMQTDLGRLQKKTDGHMDDVHALRDTYKADLVSLVVENTGAGIAGIGYVMTSVGSGFKAWAFTAVGRVYMGSSNTLAHEIGHNLGCAHDRQNSGSQAAYPYSYGYRFTGTDGRQYRDIMAYYPGTPIPYFSNPNILYQGVPIGIQDGQPSSADNARAINITAPVAANFYLGAPVGEVPNALLVVGNTTLGAGDNAVYSRLQALGYVVTVKSGSASVAADATGKKVIVISSTIISADVNTKFRASTVPVINWEQALQDDFGMTGTVTGSAGTTPAQTQVQIVSAHPIAAGLTGTQTVATAAGEFAWGNPASTAVKVGNQPGDDAKATIYAYEKGAVMVGLNAPARRVHLFLTDGTGANLSGPGWTLFDNAVKWAAGI